LSIVTQPGPSGPVLGLEVLSEMNGHMWRSFQQTAYVDGPQSALQYSAEPVEQNRPSPDGAKWIGVDPQVLFDLGQIGVRGDS